MTVLKPPVNNDLQKQEQEQALSRMEANNSV